MYMSKRHQEGFAHLLYGIEHGGGFVALTGEVGTGKTTLCHCLLQKLPENVDLALILNSRLNSIELVATICDELNVTYDKTSQSLKYLIDQLNQHLLLTHAKGRHTVLLIDEAQNLSMEVLEQLRLLTNLETTENKLLRIILVGQPELKELLQRQDLRQLNQRITARYHLLPLSFKETRAYIKHRLSVSHGDLDLFKESSIKKIYKLTKGIPRLINLLCDRSLLGAYANNVNKVNIAIVKQAATEILPEDGSKNGFKRLVVFIVIVGLLSTIFYVYKTNNNFNVLALLKNTLKPEIVSNTDVVQINPVPEITALNSTPIVEAKPLGDAQVTEAKPLGDTQVPEAKPLGDTQVPEAKPLGDAQVTEAKPLGDTQVAEAKPLGDTQVPEAKPLGDTQVPEAKPPTAPKIIVETSKDGLPEPFVEWLKKPANSLENVLSDTLKKWGKSVQHIPKVDCSSIAFTGLKCETAKTDWEKVLLINQPVILEFVLNDQSKYYALLTGISGQKGIIHFNNDVKFPSGDVLKYWDGYYWTLQPPIFEEEKIKPTHDHVANVLWLRYVLNTFDGQSALVDHPQYYDKILSKRVQHYQHEQHLGEDGKLGTRTLISLKNYAHNIEYSHLMVNE